MVQRRGMGALVMAVPGVALAIAGLFHPMHLTYATSSRWFAVHIPGLLIFPLVGVALAALVRGRTDPMAWVVRLAAYLFATCYSALDVISGVAAGYVTHHLGPGVPRPVEVRLLFGIGTPLGRVGSIALMLCCLLLLVDRLMRRGAAAGGVLLLPGAVSVHFFHIFWPWGALGMAFLGFGTGALEYSASRATAKAPPTS